MAKVGAGSTGRRGLVSHHHKLTNSEASAEHSSVGTDFGPLGCPNEGLPLAL